MKPLLRILQTAGMLPNGFSAAELETNQAPSVRQLARRGLFQERDALAALAAHTGMPLLDLQDQEIIRRLQTRELLTAVDHMHCVRHRCVPLYEEGPGGAVVVAFSDPLNLEARNGMSFLYSRPIVAVLASEDQVVHLLERNVDAQAFEELVIGTFGDHIEIIRDDAAIPTSSGTGTPEVVKLCDKIISEAARLNASDIHIEPNEGGLEIRCRIDGVMQHLMDLSRRFQLNVLSRFKLLARMDIAEKRRPQDGRFPVRISGEVIDLRVSSVPVSYGEKLVLRLLRTNSGSLTFESLGFSKDLQEKVEKILRQSGRLLLVTGPTGSGKTTTLYTALSYLRDGTQNIQTVEDPVEYQIQGIHQTQINEVAGVTFASVLRSILRQDPDVIMIGEIRDQETAEIAIQAAQTGHLVLSTLHTNSAPAAVARLIHLGIDARLVAGTLAGVLAQRLVRQLCGECSAPASPEYLRTHGELLRRFKVPPSAVRMEVGCPRCGETGFKGRTSVVSFLDLSPAVVDLIAANAPQHKIAEKAKGRGFQELDVLGAELVRAGITSPEEVKRQLPFADIQEDVAEPPASGARGKEGSSTMNERSSGGPRRRRKKSAGEPTAQPDSQANSPVTPAAATPGVPHPVTAHPVGHPGYPPPHPYMSVPMYPHAYPPYQVMYPGYPPMPMVGMPPQNPYGVPAGPPQEPAPPPATRNLEKPRRKKRRETAQVSSGLPPVEQPPAQKVPAQSASAQRVPIVLVEDHDDIRLLMKTVLETEMFEVFEAADGRAAMEAVFAHAPRAVVCDLMMPVMDGRKFLQIMKSNPATSEIPIVILTASDEKDFEVQLIELGASDFVSKSAPTNVMLARLRKALRDATKAR